MRIFRSLALAIAAAATALPAMASPGQDDTDSGAPATATFGTVRTVMLGQAMVPPRDYAKGPQLPDPKEYPSNDVGRIYDVAYQGIKDGKVQFEIRGYAIDDLVHPGSSQIQPAGLNERQVAILDLAITVTKALPDRITYAVAIDKRPEPEAICPADGCGEPVEAH
jgi:hypothetical protein